ncbi:dual specificity protein phosphatase 19a [Brienomyrus brachyistius]|uniref:dual specificity protein phosphatase 19a n=1 Tax=Brienomyrus brachyistius TaxID=42636 RepID=UPI0020B26F81|nr:dual specificity protein phosphatase 19a [Brienomyrus brachyistius]
MQSLANEIKTFSKTALRKQCTQVTTLGGKRLIETRQGSNLCVVEDSEQPEGAYGYVEDNSLDLQVGVIKPYLLLASQDVAHDLDTLKELKVSHILNVGYGVENIFPDLFVYKTLNILDLPETDITSYFHETSQFIDQVKAEEGVVLIHCNAGVSRSAAIVIGYLMSREGLAFDAAFALVKAARPAIRPNLGFYEQLKDYRP